MSYFDIDAFGLAESFAWIGSIPALIAFGGASLIELLAYYIPFVDNALDTIAIPLAAAAGTLISLSTLVDMGPLAKWSIALIAGGGLAGLIKSSSAVTRLASSATTGGLANPVVSTVETGASILMTILAIFLPVVGILLLAVLIYFIWRRYSKSA
jgi:hypothetical protein